MAEGSKEQRIDGGSYGDVYQSGGVATKVMSLANRHEQIVNLTELMMAIFIKNLDPKYASHLVPYIDASVTKEGDGYKVRLKMPEAETNLRVLMSRAKVSDRAEWLDKIIGDIAHGLAVLHGMGIAHCDLKPENVLVFCEDPPPICVKICDFGGSHVVDMTRSHKGVLTHRYAAPEAIGSQATAWMRESDMYSLGAIVHYMIYDATPTQMFAEMEDISEHDALRRIADAADLEFDQRVRTTKPEWVSEKAYGFMCECLLKDPRLRPSALDALALFSRGDETTVGNVLGRVKTTDDVFDRDFARRAILSKDDRLIGACLAMMDNVKAAKAARSGGKIGIKDMIKDMMACVDLVDALSGNRRASPSDFQAISEVVASLIEAK